MEEAYAKYGDMLIACMEELQNYSERRLRAAIANIPDGVYSYTDYLDDGGDNDPAPQKVSVDIRISGDNVIFDFTNTCKQLRAPLNISYNTLLASCFYCLKALFGSDIPATSGIFRVFDVVAPKGSLVNPIDPAPLGFDHQCGAASARCNLRCPGRCGQRPCTGWVQQHLPDNGIHS